MLTILIGMSASGKDAILRELVANHGFREIVTTTTRPMRKGEVNGKDYNFISRKEFEKEIRQRGCRMGRLLDKGLLCAGRQSVQSGNETKLLPQAD